MEKSNNALVVLNSARRREGKSSLRLPSIAPRCIEATGWFFCDTVQLPRALNSTQFTVNAPFGSSLKNGSTQNMNGVKMLAIAIIVAGVLSLAYGGFSYTKDTTAVKLGPIELSVKETKTVNIPLWAGIGAIVVGGLLLVFGNKK